MHVARAFVGVRSELGRSRVGGGIFFFEKSYNVDTKMLNNYSCKLLKYLIFNKKGAAFKAAPNSQTSLPDHPFCRYFVKFCMLGTSLYTKFQQMPLPLL